MRPRTSPRKGRRLLTLVYGMVLLADLFMLRFANVPGHPVPRMFGYVLIAILWTTIGFVAFWLRKVWGRYFFLTVLIVIMLGLFVGDFVVVDLRRQILVGPFISLLVATAIYAVAIAIVNISKNIHRLTSRAWE